MGINKSANLIKAIAYIDDGLLPGFSVYNTQLNDGSYLLVTDCIGITYRVSGRNILLGKIPSINSAVDKTDAFSRRLNESYPNYTLVGGTYINARSIMTISDIHSNLFNICLNDLIKHAKLSYGKSLNKNKLFESKSNLVHGDKYLYGNVNYISARSKVSITCPTHGVFKQTPNNHLNGNGCPKCSIENKQQTSRHSFSHISWTSHENEFSNPLLYVIRVYNDTESFVKIGITLKTIKARFGIGNNSILPYSYDILKLIHSDSLTVWNLEKKLHSEYANYSYTPLYKFKGMTECFSNTINLNNISKY